MHDKMWRRNGKDRVEKRTPGCSVSHLQLSVLLLKLLIFVRVTVGELVYFDTILLNLLSDLQRCRQRGEYKEKTRI